jgi:hypothetical protein
MSNQFLCDFKALLLDREMQRGTAIEVNLVRIRPCLKEAFSGCIRVLDDSYVQRRQT